MPIAPPNQNVNFSAAQEAVARKRKMAEALLAAAVQGNQGQMVDGHFVGPGVAGIGAQIAKALIAKRMNKSADEAQSQASEQYSSGLKTGLEDYFRTREGVTENKPQDQVIMPPNRPADGMGPVLPGVVEPGMGPVRPEQKADPRRAALEALTSQYGPLQQVGQMDLAAMLKQNGITPEELLKLPGYDPRSKVDAASGGGIKALKPEGKEHVIKDQLVRVLAGENPQVVYDGTERFNPPGVIGQSPTGAPILGQTNAKTGEARFMPQGTNVNVNPTVKLHQEADQAFATGLTTENVKHIKTSFDTAGKARDTLASLNEAQKMYSEGIRTGAGAELGQSIAKWANTLGISADPVTANTDAFKAQMAQQVFGMIGNLGAGTALSDADREFAKAAAGGEITLDGRAIQRLMDIQQVVAMNQINRHNQMLAKQREGNPELARYLTPFDVTWGTGDKSEGNERIDYDPAVKLFKTKPIETTPGKPKAGKGGVVTLEEYLKSKGR